MWRVVVCVLLVLGLGAGGVADATKRRPKRRPACDGHAGITLALSLAVRVLDDRGNVLVCHRPGGRAFAPSGYNGTPEGLVIVGSWVFYDVDGGAGDHQLHHRQDD